MATINQSGLPTLLDVAKRTAGDGSIETKIVEALSISSPFLQRVGWMPTDDGDGFLVTSRTGLPALKYRKYNEGVVPSKSTTGQFTETTGMLDGLSVVDVALAKKKGDPAAFRATEDRAFIQSYYRQVETDLFYSSSKTAPQQFMGLSPRLDTKATNPYGSQVLLHDGSASGNDQTSIWLLGLGEGKVHGIYPRNSKAGLEHKDMGEELTSDGNGGQFRAYRTYFSWQLGLAVNDYRYVVRIANVDTSALSKTGDALIVSMIEAANQLQSLTDCQPVFFVNRKIRTYLHLQARDSVKNATLSLGEFAGRPIVNCLGIPVEMTDALLNTESVIS